MVSYKPLLKVLVDKEMSKRDLMKLVDISPNTMTKIRRNEEVSLTVINKIMNSLELTDYSQVMEFIPDSKETES